ncbi:hypothetical protein L2734_03655 [Parashewanella spongiae]|uniref:antitoxin Xre-like helix-turn-helix domain-containing protein n=1 Tax=Parashewanella spongiae TaxID=342950 RepID=UPI001A9ECEB5|nr:antitoxin Xre-like helix-turn-helix domain-containing protein [Parashewanella spongiae]MCL1077281.1 hypothetical protein [Parashewanella spongiae]
MSNVPNSRSITGFKAAFKILKSWECNDQQIQKILSLDDTSFLIFKANPEKAELTNEQFTRISYLLNMHSVLRSLFNNPTNTTDFMRMINDNEFFEGRAPLDVIDSGEIEDLANTANQINKFFVV